MIDLAAVRSLSAIGEHGSVIAAASALGFTPSAVSQQVKRLERQSGVALLERVGRGVILTEHGRTLAAEGGRVAAQLEQLESDLRAGAGDVAGDVSLLGFPSGMRGLIGPVAGRLLAEHPQLRLSLHEAEPWDAIDRVAAGAADVGVVHRWGDVPIGIPATLDHLVVHHDVADVIVPGDHPLAERSSVTPSALVDETWIATPEGTICREWLGRMFHGTGHLPKVAHTSMEFESHLALVAAGLGIALVPRLGRELPTAVVAVPVTDPVPARETIAVWRRTQARSPAIRAIVAALAA